MAALNYRCCLFFTNIPYTMPLTYNEITVGELDTIVTDAITSIESNKPELHAIFFTLYNTGLRIGELLDLSRWKNNNDGTHSVVLSKFDYTRTIDDEKIHIYIRDLINRGVNYTFHNYASVSYSCKKYFGAIKFNSDNRTSTCHVFRYLFIKLNYIELGDISLVQELIKHKSSETTNRYNNDRIYLGTLG